VISVDNLDQELGFTSVRGLDPYALAGGGLSPVTTPHPKKWVSRTMAASIVAPQYVREARDGWSGAAGPQAGERAKQETADGANWGQAGCHFVPDGRS
jgi:hypothetical protein